METLKEIFARVLEVDKNSLNDNSSPENTPSWDSFNALMLISEIETNFKMKFTLDEVMSLKSFGDVRLFLKKHGIN